MTDEAGNQKDELTIPDDFPRRLPPGAVSGFQPKQLLVERDGKYTNQFSDAERAGRYLMCADLLQQLVEYTQRKMVQNLDTPLAQLLDAIESAARGKGWEVFDEEFDWIFSQLRARYTIPSQPDQ